MTAKIKSLGFTNDGTVVSTSDETYPLWSDAAEIERVEAYRAENIPSEEVRDMVRPELTKNIGEYPKVVAEVDTRIHLQTRVEHLSPRPAFAPYYALLMNIPETSPLIGKLRVTKCESSRLPLVGFSRIESAFP